MSENTIDKAKEEGIRQGIWLCITKAGEFGKSWYGKIFYTIIQI